MYAEPEAARLLEMAPSTLHYWLEGGEHRHKRYQPIIRQVSSGTKTVTWGEFVEAALLRQYRKALSVPMVELRSFIEIRVGSLGLTPWHMLAHTWERVGSYC